MACRKQALLNRAREGGGDLGDGGGGGGEGRVGGDTGDGGGGGGEEGRVVAGEFVRQFVDPVGGICQERQEAMRGKEEEEKDAAREVALEKQFEEVMDTHTHTHTHTHNNNNNVCVCVCVCVYVCIQVMKNIGGPAARLLDDNYDVSTGLLQLITNTRFSSTTYC